jgi:hypothetical protein
LYIFVNEEILVKKEITEKMMKGKIKERKKGKRQKD